MSFSLEGLELVNFLRMKSLACIWSLGGPSGEKETAVMVSRCGF